jgi:ribosomal protein S18 acetylase RimI-like enzyme
VCDDAASPCVKIDPITAIESSGALDLVVRALSADDELAALGSAWGEPLAPGEESTANDPVVLAGDADKVVHALALGRRTSTGYRIEALHVGAITPSRALATLAEAFASERLELLVRADTGEDVQEISAAARAAGLAPVFRQDTYLGSLDGVRRPSWRPFTFRSYEEVGRAGMLAILRACWGEGRGPSDKEHADELDDFLGLAAGSGSGEADVSLWRIVYRSDRLAGVALALREAGPPPLGTLLYLGLLPWARSRGLGRALHHEALWLLRSAGASVYCDATGVENAPMRRLLDGAGCERVGTSTLYARAAHPCAPRSSPTAALPIPGAPRSLLRAPMHAGTGVRSVR